MLKINYTEILNVFESKLNINDSIKSIASKYGYQPYMIARYIDILGLDETLNLLDIFERSELFKHSIRCNDLRCHCNKVIDSLERQGFVLKSVEWARYSYVVLRKPQKPSIGATHEYMKGCYYLYRDTASLIPVVLFRPLPGDYVLDSCAAPGGKTVHMLLEMKDEGMVIANDISTERLVALKFNLIRMGFKSYIITKFDARKTHEIFKNEIPKILIDAPCSAEGAIMFDPGRKTKTDYLTLAKLVSREIEILSSSIEALAPGGLIAYITCSIAPEENEYVISKILDFYRENIEIIALPNNLWSKGVEKFLGYEFNPEVQKCVRVWPHKHFMEGYFICLLKKR
ncbi:MAG: RsmB/NOP family class I SAM-dependent RNA methyltransferase [Sulfolobales archaeon]